MPSKGVTAYVYITVPGYTVELSVPGTTRSVSDQGVYIKQDFEVDSTQVDRKHFKTHGPFTFTVSKVGQKLTSQFVDIDA